MDLNVFQKRLSSEIIRANTVLEDNYIDFIKKNIKESQNSKEKFFLRKILKNSSMAQKNNWPLCQDTGFITFYIDYYHEYKDILKLKKICSEVVSSTYQKNGFRNSIMDVNRKNTGNNLPAFFHFNPIYQKNIKVSFLIKGGGSENVSGLFKLRPSDSDTKIKEYIFNYIKEEVKDKACPPYFFGIGVGGSVEVSAYNSRLALLDFSFDKENDFEKEIKNMVNTLNTGIFGTDYGKTCFGVKTIFSESHIATRIVSLAINCHSFRRGTIFFQVED